MKKSICLLLILFIIVLPISGCSQSKAKGKSNKKIAVSSMESQVLAENDRYALYWDQDNKCVVFENKSTGKRWSNIPYDVIDGDNYNTNLKSTLNISVAQLPNYKLINVQGYNGAVENGRIFSKKIKDGISVIYCFDAYKISIPVDYVLKQDSIEVSVKSENILEGSSNYQLISVALAPFLCSADNSVSGSYLFVPSGTGALMYADNTSEGSKKYVGELYGEELSKVEQNILFEKEKIRMPIFGVKDGNNGLLGVVSENSVATEIVAESGNKRLGYSNIYPVFYYRGVDVLNQKIGTSEDYIRYSEVRSSGEGKVTYFDLSGKKASYSGMASRYRDYLKSSGSIKESSVEQKNYSITFIGGAETASLKFGFNATKFLSATTFTQAKKIISNLSNKTQKFPSVRLVGFGESGVNMGKIAGGYTFASDLGTKEQRLELEDYCKEHSIDLYTDFDLIRFAKSGNGFSYNFDAAKTAILKRAERYKVNVPVRSFDEESVYRLLGRNKISDSVDKLCKFAEKDKIGGISISSLTSISYSDYDNDKYYVKGNMASDVRAFINRISSKGHVVAASGSNSYAADVSDSIYDVTLSDGNNFAFDEKVPVYQMVYSGIKPMYSSSINLFSNPKKEILYAVSTGIGLGFTIINDYHTEFADLNEAKLYSALYKDNYDLIVDALNKYGFVYEKISDSRIVDYHVFEDGLSVTKFDNGTVLYANNNSKAIDSPVGEIGAYEIKF